MEALEALEARLSEVQHSLTLRLMGLNRMSLPTPGGSQSRPSSTGQKATGNTLPAGRD